MMSQQLACCIYLSKDQSIKKLSTKARVPTEEPEGQEVINKRPECQTGADNKKTDKIETMRG